MDIYMYIYDDDGDDDDDDVVPAISNSSICYLFSLDGWQVG
jgi:hypothetical protein